MRKKPVVMIITPHILPIPDVLGGGVENVLTNLIDVNEVEGKARLIFTSNYNEQAAQHNYQYSIVYYFGKNRIICDKMTGETDRRWSLKYFLFRARRKLLHNRMTRRFFGTPGDIKDFLMDQYIWIAKREKVDYVITYDEKRIDRYQRFNRLLGEDRIYFHVMYHNVEQLEIRKVIHNSISISQFVMKEWVKDQSIPGNNTLLYNGTILSKYNKNLTESERRKRREELGIQKEDFTVVFVGRLIRVKGVEQLLAAFDKLAGLPIKLILIGSELFGKQDESKFSCAMTAKAEKMSNVIPIGYVPNEELYNYYSIADAQVVPTTCQEGAGLVAIEGMASGLPLIVTDSGGMVEYVNDECAVKVPIDDDLPDHLVKEIIRLSENRLLCKKMGEAGKKRAELFSAEEMYKGFLEIFGKEYCAVFNNHKEVVNPGEKRVRR